MDSRALLQEALQVIRQTRAVLRSKTTRTMGEDMVLEQIEIVLKNEQGGKP